MTDIRTVRCLFARWERQLPWPQYPLRRWARKFRRQLFGLRGFARIAAATTEPREICALCAFAQSLLACPKASLVPRDKFRDFVAASVAARDDVNKAAQILRRYAVNIEDEHEREILNNAAKVVEQRPHLADGDRRHNFWDFRLMGQGLSDRAFVIRSLDSRIPKSVQMRDAAIAEIVRLIMGDDTDSKLVRATLKNRKN